MHDKFLRLVSKGKNEGLTIDDCLLLRNMREQLLSSLRVVHKKHDYLNHEFFSSIELLYKKGMCGVLSYDDYLLFKEQTYGLDSKIFDYFFQEVPGENELKLFNDMDKIVSRIDYDRLLTGFSKKELRYIKRNSFLLPLAVANNTYPKIKMYGDNSYMFLCQFHNERTPSLGISDLKNLMHCFACYKSGSSVDYLMGYEDLSYEDSVKLLAQIYLFDSSGVDPKFEDLVDKYQSAILSDQYYELLVKGQTRLEARGIEQIDCVSVSDLYQRRYDTIDRIRRGERDKNFVYEKPKQLVRL